MSSAGERKIELEDGELGGMQKRDKNRKVLYYQFIINIEIDNLLTNPVD